MNEKPHIGCLGTPVRKPSELADGAKGATSCDHSHNDSTLVKTRMPTQPCAYENVPEKRTSRGWYAAKSHSSGSLRVEALQVSNKSDEKLGSVEPAALVRATKLLYMSARFYI